MSVYRDITAMIESQMEKSMEHEMDLGLFAVLQGLGSMWQFKEFIQ